MKRISIFSFLCVGVLLGACTRDIPEERGDYDPAAPVRFITHDATATDKGEAEGDDKGAATRGTPISSASQLTNMGVFASYTGTSDWSTSAKPNRMFNQKLNYSSGTWSYPAGQEEYWEPTTMVDRYSFFAYAPYGTGVYNATSNSSGNGIVVNGSSATAGVPTLTYTVPTDVTKQPDLMVAIKKNVRPTGASVPLDMKHALTSVAFQIAGTGEVVKKIAIKGVSVTGTLAVDSETITWSGHGAVTDTDFSASLSASTYTTNSTMSTNLIAGNGYLMMIPQTLTDAAKVVVTFSDDTNKELPLGTDTWAAGKKVTYNITLKPGGGEGGDILYFDTSDSNRLSVGEWDNSTVTVSNMVFTQYGSLVGFTANNSTWSSSEILFSPMRSTPSSYTSLPNYSGYDTDMEVLYGSSTMYLGSEIKAGRGDICRLAGLTSTEAQAMSASQLEAYQSGWRLPTTAENRVFIGNSSSDGTSRNHNSGYYTWTANSQSKANPGTGTFPKSGNAVLPAAGSRGTGGSVSGQGTNGYYWTHEFSYNYTNMSTLSFGSSNVNPSGSNDLAYGFANRCVPTGETPSPRPQVITVSPSTYEFAAAGETKAFTIVKLNFTGGTVSVLSKINNEFDTTASWITAASVSGSTLTVTAEAAIALDPTYPASRSATITLTGGSGIYGYVTVTQDYIPFSGDEYPGGVVEEEYLGGEGYILYFGAGNRLSVGKWSNVTPTSSMVFAKPGSTVGLAGGVIGFNPTSNDYANFASIPYGNATHNGVLIMSGQGDICRLVGLTSADAQGMSVSQLNAYDSNWRLPTDAENCWFVNGSYDAYDRASGSGYYDWWGIAGSGEIAGGSFPNGNAFLPAAGFIDPISSSLSGEGTIGWYLSSNGGYFYFNSEQVYPYDVAGGPSNGGFSVRCVPN